MITIQFASAEKIRAARGLELLSTLSNESSNSELLSIVGSVESSGEKTGLSGTLGLLLKTLAYSASGEKSFSVGVELRIGTSLGLPGVSN